MKSKRAILHIGIDKTGSTTIQNTLHQAHRELLQEERILYPSIAANHSVFLTTVFHEKPPKILPLIDSRANNKAAIGRLKNEYFDQFNTDLIKHNWRTIILSAEGLCDSPPNAILSLLEWITPHVEEIEVVAFVRHPVDWTRSVVQERLKMGFTLKQLSDTLPAPRWQQRFTPWIDLVGLKNMKIISFEDARARDGILAHFLRAASLPYERIITLLPDTVRANKAMSMEAALLISSLNRQRPLLVDGKVSHERAWPGIDRLMSIPGNPFQLSRSDIARAKERNRDDVRWLNDLLGSDYYLDVFDEAMSAPDPSKPSMPSTTVDALACLVSDLGNALTRASARTKNRQRRRRRG